MATFFKTSFVFTLLCLSVGCGSDSESDGSGGTSAGGTGGGGGGSGGTAGSSTGGVSGGGGSAGGGTGGAGPCTLGTSWQVVDDYTFAAPEPTFVVGIAADSAGNVIAIGLGKQGTMKGLVRKTEDGGASWQNATWTSGLPNDAAADAAGNVYVIAGDTAGRVLRKSSNAGDSWTDIDTIPPNSSGPTEPCNTGFVAVGANGVIVDGASCDLSGWIVRKSSDGVTFQDAFGFQPLAGKIARMQDVGVGPGGEAFATGSSQDATDATHWTTLTEGAATASVSDDFQLAAGQSANGRKFSGTTQLTVAGFASDGATTQGFLRRLEGTTWTTIDTFPTRIQDAVQVENQIVVTGEIEENGINRVVTRISNDGGTSFAPLDEYEYVAGKQTHPSALTRDPQGNVYASIGAQDADDVNHWIVRKLSCQ